MSNIALNSNGTATTSESNSPTGEEEDKAFDNNTSTKWLVFNASLGVDNPVWLQFQFTGDKYGSITEYRLTSANDEDTRDPKDWTFQGSNNGTDWTILDTQTGVTFESRFLEKTYSLSQTENYVYYRLNITATRTIPSGSNAIQLASLSMIGTLEDLPIGGGDPHINPLYGHKFLVPLHLRQVLLYQYPKLDLKVIATLRTLDPDEIRDQVWTFNSGCYILADPKSPYLTQYTYFDTIFINYHKTWIKILMDDLSIKYNIAPGDTVHVKMDLLQKGLSRFLDGHRYPPSSIGRQVEIQIGGFFGIRLCSDIHWDERHSVVLTNGFQYNDITGGLIDGKLDI